MKKIAIVGPESSGKSFLVKALAKHFNAPFTKEYARYYLKDKSSYSQNELLEIANGQIELEKKQVEEANSTLLFCDTNPLSVLVWSKIKYSNIDEELLNLYLTNKDYKHTLLLYPDIEYIADPLRESPEVNLRIEIFNEFEKYLEKEGNYSIIKESGEKRIKNAIEVIQSYLNL